MILTVTPNPSIDLLFEADRLVWDDANRVAMPRRRAGGQGVNLTRAARALGGDSVAIVLLGGRGGTELAALLDEDGTPYRPVAIAGETRIFVAVREHATGRSLLVNPRGSDLTHADRARLAAEVRASCVTDRPRWVVCSGSLPPGLGEDTYAELAGAARACGARFIADCDGAALEHAVRAGSDLIAPNQHEAGRLLGRPVSSIEEAIEAARSLRGLAPRVLIKLAERGAILAEESGTWRAHGEPLRAGSAVGAGDAFLAAFLVADSRGEEPPAALRSAVAAGSAVLLGEGAALLRREDHEKALRSVMLAAI